MVCLKNCFSKCSFAVLLVLKDEDVWRKCIFFSFALQKCARKACGQQGYNNDQFGLDLWSRLACLLTENERSARPQSVGGLKDQPAFVFREVQLSARHL